MKMIPIGIQIYQSTISDELYKFLLDQYENHLESYNQLYQNENYFGGRDFEFLKPAHKQFVENQLSKHVIEYIGKNNLRLLNQWINIQAHDGFQPVHNHTGIISYVIYLKFPSTYKTMKASVDSVSTMWKVLYNLIMDMQTAYFRHKHWYIQKNVCY